MNHSSNNSLMLLIFQHKHLHGTKDQPTNQVFKSIRDVFLQSSLALFHIESDYVNKVMSKDIYTMIDTYGSGSSKGRNQGRFTQEGQLLSDFPDAKQLDIVQQSSINLNETIGKIGLV